MADEQPRDQFIPRAQAEAIVAEKTNDTHNTMAAAIAAVMDRHTQTVINITSEVRALEARLREAQAAVNAVRVESARLTTELSRKRELAGHAAKVLDKLAPLGAEAIEVGEFDELCVELRGMLTALAKEEIAAG